MTTKADALRDAAAVLMNEAARLDAVAKDAPQPVQIGPLAAGSGFWPGDPAFRGSASVGKDWRDIHGDLLKEATADSMWQVQLRSIHYNNGGDQADCNKIVREKHARGECGEPVFPNPRQEWEL